MMCNREREINYWNIAAFVLLWMQLVLHAFKCPCIMLEESLKYKNIYLSSAAVICWFATFFFTFCKSLYRICHWSVDRKGWILLKKPEELLKGSGWIGKERVGLDNRSCICSLTLHCPSLTQEYRAITKWLCLTGVWVAALSQLFSLSVREGRSLVQVLLIIAAILQNNGNSSFEMLCHTASEIFDRTCPSVW